MYDHDAIAIAVRFALQGWAHFQAGYWSAGLRLTDAENPIIDEIESWITAGTLSPGTVAIEYRSQGQVVGLFFLSGVAPTGDTP